MVISEEVLKVIISLVVLLILTGVLIALVSHFSELKKEEKGKNLEIKLYVLFLVSILSILIGNVLGVYYSNLNSSNFTVNFWIKLLILLPLPILVPAFYLILKSNKSS